MTTLNRCIMEAKQGATEVRIREKDVRGIAEHFRVSQSRTNELSIDFLADAIRHGKLKIFGARVVVIP